MKDWKVVTRYPRQRYFRTSITGLTWDQAEEISDEINRNTPAEAWRLHRTSIYLTDTNGKSWPVRDEEQEVWT